MSKKHSKRWFNLSFRAKVFIVVGIIALAMTVALVVVLIRLNQPPANVETGATAAQKAARAKNIAQVQRDGVIHQNAAAAIKAGDIAKADEIYSSEIASEPNATHKVQLYINQSQLLYDSGNASESIKVALQAVDASSDKFLAADWLARIYSDQKQYANAAHYYALAGQWATSPTNEALFNKAYFDTQVARVTALENQ